MDEIIILNIKLQKGSGVAQLVEQSLPAPEVRCLNQFIGKIYIEHCLPSTLKKRRKQKKKRPGMAH